MNSQLLWAIFAGLCFGVWPAIIRPTNLPGYWVPVLIGIGTSLGGFVGWRAPVSTPVWSAIAICISAGVVNGVGQIVYGRMICSPNIDLSITVPVIGIVMVASATIVSIIFFREAITISKAAGILLVCVAIYLLNR